jgi:threonine-phosphate decarboxylase
MPSVKFLSNNRDLTQSVHGGRVYETARRWGIAPEKVIDFSANINPLGPPAGMLTALENCLVPNNLRTYPDSHALVSALAKKYGVATDGIVVGAGSAGLIFAVLRAVKPATALVMEPGFDEYFRACAAVESEVVCLRLTEKNSFELDFATLARIIEARQCELLILNSPHNPTGRLYAREDLLALIDLAEEKDVAVLMDEAFVDYTPQASLLPVTTTKSRLIVLRSLTKFYAIPGLRVGYAVCATGMAAAIRVQLDAWPVSTIALEAGVAALADDDFARESRRINAQAREEFAASMREIGLSVFSSAANFLLVKLPSGSGADLARYLERSQTLIRLCDSFRGLGDSYIRLAVRSRADNLRLVSQIENWLKENEYC